MEITVLGAAGGEVPGASLTGFKIDQSLLLDAGTIGHALAIEEQQAIKHVVITHAHLDHIHALPFLLDNLVGKISEPVKVFSHQDIIDVIQQHIFNNKIWPDFTVIPSKEHPVVELCAIKPANRIQIGHFGVEAIEVDHAFKAVAYIINDHHSSVVFSGDTGPVTALWDKVKSVNNLKAVFLECSFPAKMQAMAKLTKHLSVADIGNELQKAGLSDDVPVYLYHTKPAYTDEIIAEAAGIKPYQIRVCSAGEKIVV